MLSMLMLFFPFSMSETKDCETPQRSRISLWLNFASFRASRNLFAKYSLSGHECGLNVARSACTVMFRWCPPTRKVLITQLFLRLFFNAIGKIFIAAEAI